MKNRNRYETGSLPWIVMTIVEFALIYLLAPVVAFIILYIIARISGAG